MASTRLNQHHRQIMLSRAMESVVLDKKIVNAEEKAYKKVVKLIKSALNKKFPADEMAVLKKYNFLEKYSDIRLQLTGSSSAVSGFEFRSNDPAGDFPKRDYYAPAFYLGDTIGKAVIAHEKALEEKDNLVERTRTDFSVLLDTCNTFEQAVSAWSGFEACREEVTHRNVVAINDEIKNRVANYKTKAA